MAHKSLKDGPTESTELGNLPHEDASLNSLSVVLRSARYEEVSKVDVTFSAVAVDGWRRPGPSFAKADGSAQPHGFAQGNRQHPNIRISEIRCALSSLKGYSNFT